MWKFLPFRIARVITVALAVLLIFSACSNDRTPESSDDPMGADDLITEPAEPGAPEAASSEVEIEEESEIPVVPLESFDISAEKAKELLKDDGTGIVAISSPEQLAALSALVNSGDESYKGKTYVLQNDISLSGYDFKPIGGFDSGYEGYDFNAHFDGGDHLVKNLTIRDAGFEEGTGLFGRVGPTGKVENLHITNGRVNGKYSTGGLAGRSAGMLRNCSYQGEVFSEYDNIGGLVGSIVFEDTGSNVSACFVNAAVSGNYNTGVFVGEILFGAALNDCYALGSVTAVKGSAGDNAERIGGFAGGNMNAEISRCYSNAEVYTNVMSSLVGAFIGFSDGTQKDCYYNHTATSNWKPVGNGESGSDDEPDEDSENNGIVLSANGVNGCETLTLCERETFAGWDFEGVWDISESRNRGLPFLR